MARIIEVTDFEIPELDVFARMTEAQLLNRHEPQKGLFIAETPMVITTALDAGCVPVAAFMESRYLESGDSVVLERLGNIPVYVAPLDVMVKLTGYNLTRGFLCAMYRPKLTDFETVCKDARRLVVLVVVMNPTNVGAIFRSAAALGMDGIVLSQSCSNPLYRRAIRVSMGTVFQIPWTFFKEDVLAEGGIKRLQDMGFKVAAMALSDKSIGIDEPKLLEEEKLAIVLGTEGFGLPQATIEACDYTVRIPMARGVDSLNVAAASAVAFWQLSGKR